MRFRLTLNKIAHSVFIYPTLRKCISLRQHVVQKRRKSYLEQENKTNYLKCKKVRKKNLFTSVWTLCPVSFFSLQVICNTLLLISHSCLFDFFYLTDVLQKNYFFHCLQKVGRCSRSLPPLGGAAAGRLDVQVLPESPEHAVQQS